MTKALFVNTNPLEALSYLQNIIFKVPEEQQINKFNGQVFTPSQYHYHGAGVLVQQGHIDTNAMSQVTNFVVEFFECMNEFWRPGHNA